ncbi:MAG: toll/interleukin-1 receptor domain-containing protein [Myxococcales bacterium]|nr:toll/interleukin-1 receptor domain-containing protein [Myxococcales bacterium]
MLYQVLIRFEDAESEAANQLADVLQTRGVRTELASRTIHDDAEPPVNIRNAVDLADGVVFVLSAQSVERPWVLFECGTVLAMDRPVVFLFSQAPTGESLPEPLRNLRRFPLETIVHRLNVGEPPTPAVHDVLFGLPPIRATKALRNRISAHLNTTIAHLPRIAGMFGEGLQISDQFEPVSFVTNPEYDPDLHLFPESYKDRIVIDTIHGGDFIPAQIYRSLAQRLSDQMLFEHVNKGYAREKDWGCNYIAAGLVRALNLPGFYRVNIARVLLDFGRFPGITRANADYLSRFAINYPFSHYLSHAEKKKVLEDYYDRISETYEKAVRRAVLKLAVHTYDKYNPTDMPGEKGTLRPESSIIYSTMAYHTTKRMPVGLFDPYYPDEFGEFTADRKLAARISLDLERGGIAVGHNHPYALPEGSVEVRAQVWFFFSYLRKRFEEMNPDSRVSPAYEWVWRMLLDTNLRSAESEMLRSYLHMFRRPPSDWAAGVFGLSAGFPEQLEGTLERAREAYEKIGDFLYGNRDQIIGDYRSSNRRPSSLGIEFRKDHIWTYRGDEPVTLDGPDVLHMAQLQHVVGVTAQSILTYLNEDRPEPSDTL